MNMATAIAKNIFVASDWVLGTLKFSDKWQDPVTGVRDTVYYMLDNGLSSSFTTEQGNIGVIISAPEPGQPAPKTKMLQIPNGRAVIASCPEKMMIHKDTLVLMAIPEYEKALAKVSTALTEGVSATA